MHTPHTPVLSAGDLYLTASHWKVSQSFSECQCCHKAHTVGHRKLQAISQDCEDRLWYQSHMLAPVTAHQALNTTRGPTAQHPNYSYNQQEVFWANLVNSTSRVSNTQHFSVRADYLQPKSSFAVDQGSLHNTVAQVPKPVAAHLFHHECANYMTVLHKTRDLELRSQQDDSHHFWSDGSGPCTATCHE